MRMYDNGIYRDMTPEETAAATALATERETRPFNEGEALRFLLGRTLNGLEVEDSTALRLTEFYPVWEPGREYPAGFLARYAGALWRSLLGHTSDEASFPRMPGLSRSVLLWEQVAGQSEFKIQN